MQGLGTAQGHAYQEAGSLGAPRGSPLQEEGEGPEVGGGRPTSFSNFKMFTMDMYYLITICFSFESHAWHGPASTPLLLLFPLPLHPSLPPPAEKCPEKLSLTAQFKLLSTSSVLPTPGDHRILFSPGWS